MTSDALRRGSALALLFFSSLTAAAREPLEPIPEVTSDRGWLVDLAVDEARRTEVLEQLAQHRRLRQPDAFRGVLEGWKAELAAAQRTLREELEAEGVEVTSFWLTGDVGIRGATPELLEELAGRSGVLGIQAERYLAPALKTATDAQHHDSQGANQLTVGGVPIEGGGITIAIVDSGIDADMNGTGRPHAAFFIDGLPGNQTGPGLSGSRLLSYEAPGALAGPDPEDLFGHGTRVASIAAGAQWSPLGDVGDGPAPSALIRSYKISDDGFGGGLASTMSMVAAFNELASQPDVLVANMSYEGDPNSNAMPNPTVDAAAQSGVFVTLSAGNNGGTTTYANGSNNALVVGGSWVSSKQPYNANPYVSGYGPLPDHRLYPHILAVGEEIACAQADADFTFQNSWGTSGAAALVAGSGALVRQADPSLSGLETKALLVNTAEEVTLGKAEARGFGYLKSKVAVEAALAGLVESELAVPDTHHRWTVDLTAGEAFVTTLAWYGNGDAVDLDLRITAPSGSETYSTSAVDNLEQLRYTASETGAHFVEVLPTAIPGGPVEFALAGVSGAPSVQPYGCDGGGPWILVVEPNQVDVGESFTIKGCNLMPATSVEIGGIPASFTVDSDKSLRVTVPDGVAAGTPQVKVDAPLGRAFSNVGVGAAGPLIWALADGLNVWPGMMVPVHAETEPGDLVFMLVSLLAGETDWPGLFHVDIGGGGFGLFLLSAGVADGFGLYSSDPFTHTGSLPAGTKVHFQAVVLDAVTPVLPLVESNAMFLMMF